ncbi:MAG: M48 family metalloprotease [Spirochaetaceae bacterium]
MKTFLLMTVLTVLFVIVGGAIAGEGGAIVALAVAVAMNVAVWWNSDRLAIRMTRSRPLSRAQSPELYDMVERLAKRASIPAPKVYLQPSAQPNAFATGRSPRNAVIAVTDGLVQQLNANEIEGVIAHELAHIKHYDTLISTVAAAFAGAITVLARIGTWGLLLGGGRGRDNGNAITLLLAIVLAPLAAMLIRMAVSRSREFAADRRAADITGSPEGLMNALSKLDSLSQRSRMQVNEAAGHMYIVNPLRGAGGMAALFSTHPPMEKRIERLRRITEKGQATARLRTR